MTKSISDDDICSDCTHCLYSPGDHSSCQKDFPGDANSDGYVIACWEYTPQQVPGQNIHFNW